MANNSKITSDRINFSNRKKLNTDFSNKDLKRSNCFSTDFTGSTFNNVSLKGAQFKNCNFTDCKFETAEFVATNLRNCKFVNTQFKNVIFESTNLDGVSFENATFENVIIVHTDVSKVINFDAEDKGIRLIVEQPELEVSDRLDRAIRASKKNEFIKKSGVLDSKDGKNNPISIMILLENFNEEVLITSFARLKAEIEKDFWTLNFLINQIKAYQAEDKK